MDRGTRNKLGPTHRIVGVFDQKQYAEQQTARIARRARLNWHNDNLLAKAKAGDTVEVLSPQGYPTRIRVTELQIKVADHLVAGYESLEDYIAAEMELAYRDSSFVDGELYVLGEVNDMHAATTAVAIHEREGFRDVRAEPIARAAA